MHQRPIPAQCILGTGHIVCLIGGGVCGIRRDLTHRHRPRVRFLRHPTRIQHALQGACGSDRLIEHGLVFVAILGIEGLLRQKPRQTDHRVGGEILLAAARIAGPSHLMPRICHRYRLRGLR